MTLSKGWAEATIGDIALVNMGQSPSGEYTNSEGAGLPLIGGAADIGAYGLKPTRHTSAPTKIAGPGDIILCVRATIGRLAVADREVCLGRGVAGLRSCVDARWLVWLLRENADALDQAGVGSTFRQIDSGTLNRWPIGVPPAAEQRRIVAKLDALTHRIARAKAELNRVPILTKRLRETAVENLLSPSSAQTGWRRQNLGALMDEGPTNGWSPKSDPSAKGVLTLKLTATTSGRFRLDEGAVKRIHETPSKNSKFWLRTGDLLVQRANSLEHVGASAIFDGPSHTYIYPDLMMRLRFNNPSLTRLVWYRLNSPSTRRHFRDKATGTAGNMPKISGSVVREVTIELPQESYWKGLVAKLDAIFARANRLEAEAGHAGELLDRLESSILAKAFRGELVSQDPNDEPASVLLERIRVSRSVAPKPNRGRRAISTDV